MDSLLAVNAVDLLSRWVHVGTAIVVVGGSVFMRFVLMPAAEELSDEQHQALRQRVLKTWQKFVMAGIALFLLSGFYNYIKVAMPQHDGDGLYHALMGIKILLALGVFFLASALTGRSPALEGIRQNAKRWLAVTILLATVIVAIAGFLKVRGTPGGSSDAASAALSRPAAPASALWDNASNESKWSSPAWRRC